MPRVADALLETLEISKVIYEGELFLIGIHLDSS